MKSGFVIAAVLLFFRTNSVPQSKVLQSITDSTSVTYTLHHPLHKIEATSKEATISAEVDTVSKEIKSVTAKVDVMSFDSGNSNRDSHAMEVVDALSFPEVSFISTAIDTAGDSIKVTGALTFHGVSKGIVAIMIPSWLDREVDVRGAFTISLTAFNVDRPSFLMIPVSDSLYFTMKAAFPYH